MKYTIDVNKIYPLSASKNTKQRKIARIETVSSLFNAYTNKTNKTPKSGGKKRYILLRLS
ncbi:MAG: hypothetical protein WC656_01150 [Sulfurimonas sp.]|jgi:hypothetical protein